MIYIPAVVQRSSYVFDLTIPFISVTLCITAYVHVHTHKYTYTLLPFPPNM